ncbi:MAG: ComF family protein [Thermogemmatispora sp.]|uniref:ComF family protein n=1 Tax=Thermogemmatispora sp. TaxID=1968838 RepID=UPI002611417F|nr:ComF family protein [Thermogemmatispora sp.]MBX5456119.1 ComF family protein [Thermogemmatispora sp.]
MKRRLPFTHWAEHLLDLLFPPCCAGCASSGSLLCPACLRAIARLQEQRCARCTLPCRGADCRRCRFSSSSLFALQAVALYEEPLRTCIQHLKYRGTTRLAQPLGGMLAACYRRYHLRADLVIAVPLHAERERLRGYNHARLLADVCAHELGLPCAHPLLQRVRATAAQVGLPSSERRQNLVGAFQCQPQRSALPLSGSTILLIDDVCTTGATLEACTTALLQGGASRVQALVLAIPG